MTTPDFVIRKVDISEERGRAYELRCAGALTSPAPSPPGHAHGRAAAGIRPWTRRRVTRAVASLHSRVTTQRRSASSVSASSLTVSVSVGSSLVSALVRRGLASVRRLFRCCCVGCVASGTQSVASLELLRPPRRVHSSTDCATSSTAGPSHSFCGTSPASSGDSIPGSSS